MCGIAGAYIHSDDKGVNATEIVYELLYPLDHRGREGWGIVSLDGEAYHHIRKKGHLFPAKELSSFMGRVSVGHLRYSTTDGKAGEENLQPMEYSSSEGRWFIGTNGNTPMYKEFRKKYEEEPWNWTFESGNDAELILRLIIHNYSQIDGGADRDDRVAKAIESTLLELDCACSTFLLTPWGTLFIFRDQRRFRPLSLGRKGKSFFFASETCSFESLEIEYERDLKASEIVSVSKDMKQVSYFMPELQQSSCKFEFDYFSSPDSKIFGHYVDPVRKDLGRQTAKENPPATIDGDCIVTGVPDSGTSAALGFEEESRIRFQNALLRNQRIPRTFTNPDQLTREQEVWRKFRANKPVVMGKKVYVVDDSIVRSTTIKVI